METSCQSDIFCMFVFFTARNLTILFHSHHSQIFVFSHSSKSCQNNNNNSNNNTYRHTLWKCERPKHLFGTECGHWTYMADQQWQHRNISHSRLGGYFIPTPQYLACCNACWSTGDQAYGLHQDHGAVLSWKETKFQQRTWRRVGAPAVVLQGGDSFTPVKQPCWIWRGLRRFLKVCVCECMCVMLLAQCSTHPHVVNMWSQQRAQGSAQDQSYSIKWTSRKSCFIFLKLI